MDKLRWAVQAGDQVGDSEDDQKCGDHFIDKDLECHDGDAHRPTPGNNPYWQGDRKGPEDKSKTPERKEGEKNQRGHERDRTEHTKQNRERMEMLLDNGHTPESLGRDNVNHFADMMEENYGRPLTDTDVHTLVDMVNQKMGESFSQDPEQKGIHDPTAPKGFKGPKGREMSRPDSYHKQTTDKEYTPSGRGGPEEGGLYDHYKNILKDRIKGGGEGAPKNEGPSEEMKDEQDKWGDEGYQGEEAPDAGKGYEYQERQVDEWDPSQSPEEAKPYMQKERRRQTQKDYKRKKDASKKAENASVASDLNWSGARIMQDRVDDNYQSPQGGCPEDDVAEGRPCGDGEDPERGKCNPNMAPEPTGRQPNPRKPEYDTGVSKGPQSDLPKAFKGAPKEGVGLKPTADPAREQRMAQHVSTLTQDDGSDHTNTANGMGRMMGSRKPRQLDDGGFLVGSPAGSPEQAKQQNDDYKDTLTKSGWSNQSDMGGSSTWSKGNTVVQLKMGANKGGQQGNQMKVVGPQAQPKKKGFFR